ncbi:MAG TPA: amphi-Trp domain-containing protein [Spirochaetes bacterium]|nr:amphi-Trp domain-containing protein [Spirochaetota bacterium]
MSKELKHESIENCESAVQYLKAIGEGFEKGQLVLGNGKDQFLLEPSDRLKMKVKVKRKNGKVKVSVKFIWNEEADIKVFNNDFQLIPETA